MVEVRQWLRGRIGGWQYSVEYKEDKVVKRPHSFWFTVLRILFTQPWHLLELNLLGRAREVRKEREKSVENLKEMSFDRSIIGNAVFKGDEVHQDRVTPVLQVLDEKSREEIVDDYIGLLKECWRLGFHESTFKFTVNCGYNEDDEMIVLDVGELDFRKEGVREAIQNEKWLNQHSYNAHLDRKTKNYFRKRMAEEITTEELDRLWKKKL